MAGQNRSYARTGHGANRGLVAFFRGAFILLAAISVSFALGFFVFARLVPTGANEPSSGTAAPSGQNPHAAAAAPTHRPAKQTQAPNDGPEVLPETSVQKPGKIDADAPRSGTAPADGADSNGNIPRSHSGDGQASGSNTTTPETGGTTGSQPGVRGSRTRGTGDTGAIQSPGSPDASGAAPDASPNTSDTNGAPAQDAAEPRTGVYRVQIGVFSTREKAEEVARAAVEKGVAAGVHVITKDGRTLYRVQHSTRHSHAKAEEDLLELKSVGVDATIINPS